MKKILILADLVFSVATVSADLSDSQFNQISNRLNYLQEQARLIKEAVNSLNATIQSQERINPADITNMLHAVQQIRGFLSEFRDDYLENWNYYFEDIDSLVDDIFGHCSQIESVLWECSDNIDWMANSLSYIEDDVWNILEDVNQIARVLNDVYDEVRYLRLQNHQDLSSIAGYLAVLEALDKYSVLSYQVLSNLNWTVQNNIVNNMTVDLSPVLYKQDSAIAQISAVNQRMYQWEQLYGWIYNLTRYNNSYVTVYKPPRLFYSKGDTAAGGEDGGYQNQEYVNDIWDMITMQLKHINESQSYNGESLQSIGYLLSDIKGLIGSTNFTFAPENNSVFSDPSGTMETLKGKFSYSVNSFNLPTFSLPTLSATLPTSLSLAIPHFNMSLSLGSFSSLWTLIRYCSKVLIFTTLFGSIIFFVSLGLKLVQSQFVKGILQQLLVMLK